MTRRGKRLRRTKSLTITVFLMHLLSSSFSCFHVRTFRFLFAVINLLVLEVPFGCCRVSPCPSVVPSHSSPYTLRVPERSGGTNRVTEGKEVRPDTKRTEQRRS